MKLKEIIKSLETLAPLCLQEDYDNSGLQVGDPEQEICRALVCLDITEEILDEAVSENCQLIVSHHPLIFRPLKQVSVSTYQQRCVVKAVRSGIAIYSAHTSLDNAPGGVNHRIAEKLGLVNVSWLSSRDGGASGSGLAGELVIPERDTDFLRRVADMFGVKCIQHSRTSGRMLSRIAVCGGAGAFLMHDAISTGADCFVCGEFHYHDYFENDGMLLACLGHYQSEQFTQDILAEVLAGCGGVDVIKTRYNTNPIEYGTE